MRNRLALIWAVILGRPICHKMHIYGNVTVTSSSHLAGSTIYPFSQFTPDDKGGRA